MMFEKPTDSTKSGPERTDLILAALAAATRRHALRYFLDSSDKTATVDDLTRYVAKRLDDRPRAHVRIHLHHVDLPKLEDAGLVEYDSQAHRVRYREHPFVEEIVERDEELGLTAHRQ